jgi:hypothetical protein
MRSASTHGPHCERIDGTCGKASLQIKDYHTIGGVLQFCIQCHRFHRLDLALPFRSPRPLSECNSPALAACLLDSCATKNESFLLGLDSWSSKYGTIACSAPCASRPTLAALHFDRFYNKTRVPFLSLRSKHTSLSSLHPSFQPIHKTFQPRLHPAGLGPATSCV